jgi:hypothetical protein
MSITKGTAEVSYRLTPQQILAIIAADMGVPASDVSMEVHIEMRHSDRLERDTATPIFIGCTMRKQESKP